MVASPLVLHNLLLVSSCKILHFVMCYMNQNRNINKLSRLHNTDWKSSLRNFKRGGYFSPDWVWILNGNFIYSCTCSFYKELPLCYEMLNVYSRVERSHFIVVHCVYWEKVEQVFWSCDIFFLHMLWYCTLPQTVCIELVLPPPPTVSSLSVLLEITLQRI